MNFLYALAKAGILWSLNSSVSKTPRQGTPYPSQQLTLVMEDGTTFVRDFNLHSALNVHQFAAVVMKENAPRHPVLQEWLHSHGSEKVQLAQGALDNLGEVLHTALRKLADSKQSIITWNAIHHLHSSDWVALFAKSRERVEQGFVNPERPPSRRRVGLALRDVVLQTLDERSYADATDVDGTPARRTPLQEFALRSLAAGCHLTETDEWVFGWTGFLCVPVAASTEESGAAQTAAVA